MSAAAPLAIQVNGEPFAAPAGTTIAALVERLGLDRRAIAVERNGEVVHRDRQDETPLAAGDRIELVRFVQGG